MATIQDLEIEIQRIKDRNIKVEADKAWETSWMRIFSLVVITYIVAVIVLYSIGVADFLRGALVPTVGFFLSVQSLPAIKKQWVKKFLRK